jgi:hypothetical protein
MRLNLTSGERQNSLKNGTITWLSMGISLEASQFVFLCNTLGHNLSLDTNRDSLRSEIRRMPKRSTASQRTSIEEKRGKLASRLHSFHQKAEEFMGETGDDDINMLPQVTGYELDDVEESEDEDADSNDEEMTESDDDGDDDDGDRESETPENTVLCIPSSLTTVDIERLGLQSLAQQELQLRQGQANDSLQALRMALGHKSILYRTKIRKAKSTKGKKQGWDDIKVAALKVNKHVRAYRRARQAMERLGADSATLRRYQKIEREHLKLSGDITDENRYGQRNDKLPWFWTLEGQTSQGSGTWMQECKCVTYS